MIWNLWRDAPTEPGVYSIWAGNTLLYVGCTGRGIKTRLRTHHRIADFLLHNADRIGFIVISDRMQRYVTEEYLNKKHKPILALPTGAAAHTRIERYELEKSTTRTVERDEYAQT